MKKDVYRAGILFKGIAPMRVANPLHRNAIADSKLKGIGVSDPRLISG